MLNFLQLLSLINSLLPLVLQTVHSVEALFPQSGLGANKFKMVTEVVSAAAKASGVVEAQLPALVSVLSPIVSNVVAIANATGLFKSASPSLSLIPKA